MAVEDIAEVERRGLLVTRSSKSSGSLEELLVSCPCGSWDGLNMMVSIATASWTSLSSTASLPVREKKQRHLGSLWPEQCDSTQSLFLEPSSSLGRTWEEEGIWKPDVNTMWRGWVRCDRMEMRLFSTFVGMCAYRNVCWPETSFSPCLPVAVAHNLLLLNRISRAVEEDYYTWTWE